MLILCVFISTLIFEYLIFNENASSGGGPIYACVPIDLHVTRDHGIS